MQYPALLIDRLKFRENAEQLMALFQSRGKRVHFVTKCFCAYEPLIQELLDCGCRHFADSRLENFPAFQSFGEDSILLRLPMLSELREVVAGCDISLNSEIDTINALSDVALSLGRRHGIILMIELGDRREGILPDEIDTYVRTIMNLRGVRLRGIGANFNCYGAVIPDEEKMRQLAEIAEYIEQRYHIQLDYVSGGNSGSLYLLEEGRLPEKVNHLRIGEALLLGRETSFGRGFIGLNQDVFTFRAEVIECKRKPSLPDGQIGRNALGEVVHFEDHGIIRRAILAVGAQDLDPRSLGPQLKGIQFLGNSSDHSIYDISASTKCIRTGDFLDFSVNYSALNRLFTSPYVHKYMI